MSHLKNSIYASVILACSMYSLPAIADVRTDALTVKIEDAKFAPLRGGPIEIAILSGNPQKGPSSILLKFPPNFPGGMHWHTNDYDAVLLKGASKHWIEGQTAADVPLLGPGDYFFQPGGGHTIHQDSFPSDEESILYIHFDGPVDSFEVK